MARAPKTPLVCEEITVDPPKAGEVRVKVIANAVSIVAYYNTSLSLSLMGTCHFTAGGAGRRAHFHLVYLGNTCTRISYHFVALI